MKAEKLVKKCLEREQGYDIRNFMYVLRGCNTGAIGDVENKEKSGYYQWLPCLIDQVKPKQIIELGGAMGVADIMMLNAKYEDFDLWTITLQEHGLEYSFIVDDYPSLHMVIGDDLDIGNWPRKLNLSQTDIWFYDSLHTEEQLRAELDLYNPFHKQGAILLFDDIHMIELEPVWQDILQGKWGRWDCYDATNELHWSGFGVCIQQ